MAEIRNFKPIYDFEEMKVRLKKSK